MLIGLAEKWPRCRASSVSGLFLSEFDGLYRYLYLIFSEDGIVIG